MQTDMRPSIENSGQWEAWVDLLRGLATFTMIAANMAPTLLHEPHPFWFRVYGTFAAPLFIFLAGMMAALGVLRKNHGMGYFAARGAWLLFWAGVQDMWEWQIWPGTSVNILYLLGVSLPVAWLAMRLPAVTRVAATLALFVMPHGLRMAWGYDADESFYLDIEDTTPLEWFRQWRSVALAWTVNGDFPLAPWLGFTLLGTWAAECRWGTDPISFGEKAFRVGSAACLGAGLLAWWGWPGEQFTRGGYTELFYPPVFGYLLTSAGLIGVLLTWADGRPGDGAAGRALQHLGRASLFVYLAHILLIKFVLAPAFGPLDMVQFWVVYMAFSGMLVAWNAWVLRPLRGAGPCWPLPVRMLLGG